MNDRKRSEDSACEPPADDFRCVCDPDDLFDPPDPRPRAVEGCPAHRARRAAQLFVERNGTEAER